MKITESQIRMIIRESLLKEYRGAYSDFRKKTWQQCNLDLPDSYIRAQGKASVKRAEKLASLAARVYGIPGEFCNLFNSILGDNPENASRSSGRRNRGPQTQVRTLTPAYFITFNSDLSTRPSAFISQIVAQQNKPDADRITAIESDNAAYDTLRAEIASKKNLAPMAAGDQILDLLASASGVSISRNISKDIRNKSAERATANVSDTAITDEIIEEALDMIRRIASKNSNETNLKRIYLTGGSRSPYDAWLSNLRL